MLLFFTLFGFLFQLHQLNQPKAPPKAAPKIGAAVAPDIVMLPGDVWLISGETTNPVSPLAWRRFSFVLGNLLARSGARLGRFVSKDREFAFQVSPVTKAIPFNVPSHDPPFFFKRAVRVPPTLVR